MAHVCWTQTVNLAVSAAVTLPALSAAALVDLMAVTRWQPASLCQQLHLLPLLTHAMHAPNAVTA